MGGQGDRVDTMKRLCVKVKRTISIVYLENINRINPTTDDPSAWFLYPLFGYY